MTFNERATALLELPVSPITWDSILRESDRIHREFAHIPSSVKWALDYKCFLVEHGRQNLGEAVRHLRSALSFAPYEMSLIEDYKQIVGKQAEIDSLILVISSRVNVDRALRLAAFLEDAGLDYMIVSGADTPAIAHPRALQVDASDAYEATPRKVAAALTWVYENIGTNVGVLKVDDHMLLQDAGRLRSSLQEAAAHGGYAGVPVGGLDHDRCAHWGKCLNQEMNRRGYGRPVMRSWADGGAYYLGARALEKLVLSFIRFPGLLEGEFYEDKLVGDTLVFEGEALIQHARHTHFGFVDNGVTAGAGFVPDPVAVPAASTRPPAAQTRPLPSAAAPPVPAATPPAAAPPRAKGSPLKLSDWNAR